MLKTLALGLPVGLLFGYALQRGRFCMYTAFRDLLFARDFTLFRAYILALLVQMAIIHGLDAAGYLTVRPFEFTWLAAIVGGSIFGVGISLAGGCASGSWYRIGEGMVGSILAVLGYGLGVAATFWGPLNPLSAYLSAYRTPYALASLQGLTGLPKWPRSAGSGPRPPPSCLCPRITLPGGCGPGPRAGFHPFGRRRVFQESLSKSWRAPSAFRASRIWPAPSGRSARRPYSCLIAGGVRLPRRDASPPRASSAVCALSPELPSSVDRPASFVSSTPWYGGGRLPSSSSASKG